jgi:hypothetical protein
LRQHTPSVADAAVTLNEQGLAVLPVDAKTKRPLIHGGVHSASADVNITRARFRAFIAYLQGQPARNRRPREGRDEPPRLSAATVRRYFRVLSAMLGTAYDAGMIDRNPAQGVRVVVPGERPRDVLPVRVDGLGRLG